jgi:hypothetical protein
MTSTAGAFGRCQSPVGIDLALEAVEERPTGGRGQLTRIALAVE